jgi:hypothetical protein
MASIYSEYTACQYGIDGSAKIATHFYPLEKASKIAYRVIDLTNIFINQSSLPLACLSSQIKDLVLAIESTRFSCVSFPLFFRNKSGKSFFQVKSGVQIAEKISITSHLVLKTLFGADKVELIRLGIIGSYALGNLPAFRWMLETTICLYNFFGAWDGSKVFMSTKNLLAITQLKINALDHSPMSLKKKRKWEAMKNGLEFEHTKAILKVAATVSKLVLIVFAVSIAAINIANTPCHIVILSLGVFSDSIGLVGFFYQEYCRESV